ncbi:MAG TPA: serine/threonine-protein kinase [Gemmatimonadaceae bacterium]|nr:serine/threonine-protein kinase [Gemmatimonadaceae bacterium]
MTLETDPSDSGPHSRTLSELRQSLAGRFEIIGEAGRGGMAVVFRSQDVKHQRTVALKVLRPELATAVGAERFLREIRIEARLNHPNILTLIDSGQVGDTLYYLTPWAEGGTLSELLQRETQLPLDVALRIAREVGDALSHAHSLGIIHRDVKPQNILFRSGHALLADFGIAQAVADAGRDALTETGLAVGTPRYMSPEQATPGAKVDARADQYALGCILFEMLAGDPPFMGRSTHVVLTRHLTERPPSLAVVRPDLPVHVTAAINKALEKAPAGRFESIERFLAALDEPAMRDLAPARVKKKPSWIVAGTATAALALASLLVWNPDELPLSPNKVAVFPLAARGLPAADSAAGLGVAYLIEAALERADPLQLIDVAGRLTEAELADPQTISDRAAHRIARQVGAAFALRGVVLGHPDSTTVLLRLMSVAGDTLIRQSSASGASRATPLHHLGLDALKPLLPSLIDPNRTVDLTPLRDRRAQAIALWMQGERQYRLSRFDAASGLYERALADDSLLALAAIKGAQAASWLHERTRALNLVLRALALEAHLTPRYAMLARGLESYLKGEPDTAIVRLRSALELDPEWAEPAAALGEVFTHLLPHEAPLDSLARAAFDQAIQRDSGFTSPLFHLAEDAIRYSRLKDADRLIERLQRAGADPALRRQLSLMRDCVAQPSRKPWTVTSPAQALGITRAAKSLSAGGLQSLCAEAAFRTLLQSSFASDGERWAAFLGLQGLAVARHDDNEASALVDSIVASGRGAARTLYVLNSIAGARMETDADSLAAWAQARYGANYERNSNPESLWVLLCWHRERGDLARVRSLADTLQARAAVSHDPRTLLFAQAGHAQAILAAGDTVGAIEALTALTIPGAIIDLSWGLASALPVERLLLAKLLLARGKYRESVNAASAFDHSEPIAFLPFVGESLGIRYRAALVLGNRREADSFRNRLQQLGRQDLIHAAEATRR